MGREGKCFVLFRSLGKASPEFCVKNLAQWVVLGRYAPVFKIHKVDDEVLPLLMLEDLKDVGINAVGSRRKICFVQFKSLGRASPELGFFSSFSMGEFLAIEN